MDRYVLFLNDSKDISFYPKDSFEVEKNDCFSKTSFSHCTPRIRDFFAYYIFLSLDQLSPCKLDEDMLQWRNFDDKSANSVSASPLLASEIIFYLTDTFSNPGSFLLDVYWHFSNIECGDLKIFYPLLGALKKLELWQKAEITLFCGFDETAQPSPLLQSISNFLPAKIVEITESKLMESIVLQNNRIFWRGFLHVKLKDQIPLNFDSFQLLQHCCHQDHKKPFVKFQSCTVPSNLWFGNNLKVIELVNLNTLPLFWYSGSVFILQCPIKSIAGVKFQEILEKSKNSGILCRLAFVHTAKEFLPCQEVSSSRWKNAVQKSALDMSPLIANMGQKPQNLHFVITPILKKSCASMQMPDGYLHFHVHELHLHTTVDLYTPVEEDILCLYDSESFTKCCGLTLPFEVLDRKFLTFFSRMLTIWKEKKISAILKSELQNLISELWIVYKHDFQSDTTEMNDEDLFNHAFRNKRCTNMVHDNSKRTIQSSGENDFNRSWFLNGISSSNMSATEILDFFKRPKYQAYVDSLLEACSKVENEPSLEILTNFESAIKISHHGINYNLDVLYSEARDKYHRKLIEKLIEYETLSIGSRTYVPSVIAKSFGDTPVKHKKPVRKRPMHTPRKKKRIAKVAEKLFKLRTTRESKLSNSSMATSSKQMSNSAVTPTENKTNFIVTPTKKKTNSMVTPKKKASSMVTTKTKSNTNKRKAPLSPSVNKVALHCTPTKANRTLPAVVKLTPRSKAAARKKSQKRYVRSNKKRLTNIIVKELVANGMTKDQTHFEQYIKKLYRVSMAFLKDLKSSKDLENIMQRIVKENVRLVLSLESKPKLK